MVDGLAASAASIIAMAGDQIVMADNSLLMIHNAWTMAIGDANAMRKMADTLDTVSGALVETYTKRSGQSAEDVRAMMDAETWLTAAEAKDQGFATEILTAPKKEAESAMALAASFNLASRFTAVPEALAAPIAVADEPEAPETHYLRELELLALDLGAIA
jgi:ClpP class serine protease